MVLTKEIERGALSIHTYVEDGGFACTQYLKGYSHKYQTLAA